MFQVLQVETVASAGSASVKRDFQIAGQSGLTALKCTQLVEQFGDFNGRVTISNGAISVDGRSLTDMLQLAAVAGSVVTIALAGRNAEQVMQQIIPLLGH